MCGGVCVGGGGVEGAWEVYVRQGGGVQCVCVCMRVCRSGGGLICMFARVCTCVFLM